MEKKIYKIFSIRIHIDDVRITSKLNKLYQIYTSKRKKGKEKLKKKKKCIILGIS